MIPFSLFSGYLKKSLSDTDKKLKENNDNSLIYDKDHLEKSLKSLTNTRLTFDEEMKAIKSNLLRINHPNDIKNRKENSFLSSVTALFESQLSNLNHNVNLLTLQTKKEDIRDQVNDLIQDSIHDVNNIFSKLQSMIGIHSKKFEQLSFLIQVIVHMINRCYQPLIQKLLMNFSSIIPLL